MRSTALYLFGALVNHLLHRMYRKGFFLIFWWNHIYNANNMNIRTNGFCHRKLINKGVFSSLGKIGEGKYMFHFVEYKCSFIKFINF